MVRVRRDVLRDDAGVRVTILNTLVCDRCGGRSEEYEITNDVAPQAQDWVQMGWNLNGQTYTKMLCPECKAEFDGWMKNEQ